MNNFNNIKLSKISCKVLENNQNKKRIVKVDLARENYNHLKNLYLDFLHKTESLLSLKLAKLLVDIGERERERERAKTSLPREIQQKKSDNFPYFLPLSRRGSREAKFIPPTI